LSGKDIPKALGFIPAWHLIALCLAFVSGACMAQDDASEYKVKAAIVYRLIGYVEWPPRAFASPETPITVGTLGASALAQELSRMVEGQKVAGRTITVRQLAAGEPPAGLHILFIGGRDTGRIASALASVKAQPVLTITELNQAATVGSVINLFVADDRVRFDLGLAPAQQAQIRISSRLLPLARKVTGEHM
jgi:hypothetical protein